MTKKVKRKYRMLKVNEVSAVDKPANQRPALMLKSMDASKAAEIISKLSKVHDGDDMMINMTLVQFMMMMFYISEDRAEFIAESITKSVDKPEAEVLKSLLKVATGTPLETVAKELGVEPSLFTEATAAIKQPDLSVFEDYEGKGMILKALSKTNLAKLIAESFGQVEGLSDATVTNAVTKGLNTLTMEDVLSSEDIDKAQLANLPESVKKQLADNKAELESMSKAKETANETTCTTFAKSLTVIGVDKEETEALGKALAVLTPEALAPIQKALGNALDLVNKGGLLKAAGELGSDDLSEKEQANKALDAKATELVGLDKSLTFAKAYDKVCQQYPDLYSAAS